VFGGGGEGGVEGGGEDDGVARVEGDIDFNCSSISPSVSCKLLALPL